MRAIVQINNSGPCPAWVELATKHNIETIWFNANLNVEQIQPDLVILQHVVQTHDLAQLGYGQVNCPKIASCGDAMVITSLEPVFHNLEVLTNLDVEGFDYFPAYRTWVQANARQSHEHKLRFFKQCADTLFLPLDATKEYDWIFVGQVYPAYEERLKHTRNDIVRELWRQIPNGLVIGSGGWESIIGSTDPILPVPQSEVNGFYAKSRVVVSVDAHHGDGYTSTRTLEIMHAGHCAFIYDHPGMRPLKAWIRDGEHVFFFATIAEFKEKLAYLKRYPRLGVEMGAAARQLVLNQGWTYTGWLTRALAQASNGIANQVRV